MRGFPPALRAQLAALDPAGLRRTLRPPCGVDLSSNDYLGFASDPEIARRFAAAAADLPAGSAGSRLLRGALPLHAAVEEALARFCGREEALLFPSGYQANVALLSALLRPGDFVYSDALNHASIVDGVRLGRAERRVYPHADVPALRRLLEADRPAPGALRVIVTESLFSMDGDRAPLVDLAALAEESGALLIVDEAHATGLFGRDGSGGGLVQALGIESRVLATVHTGGKALGAAGAWIAGDAPLRDYLINFARPFIFSTAPLPALAVLLREATARWNAVGAGRALEVLARARRLAARLGEIATAARLPAPISAPLAGGAAGPIVPLVIGPNARAVAVAAALERRGFDARAVRPPTVPEGTARLRLTVTWPVPPADLDRFPEAAAEALRETAP